MKRTERVVATIVRTTKQRGELAIRDLSVEGARLVGPLELFESERVSIELPFDEPLKLTAEVTHVDRQRKVIEVEFRGLSPQASARIEQSIEQMLARVRAAAPPMVLVIHPEVDVSSALERDLARVGVGARVIATPVGVADQLADPDVRFTAVVLAGSFGEQAGAVLQELEDRFAPLRRVLLFGEQIEPIAHPAAARVHAVLRTPWHFKGLARALELPPDNILTTYDQLKALNLEIGVKKRDV